MIVDIKTAEALATSIIDLRDARDAGQMSADDYRGAALILLTDVYWKLSLPAMSRLRRVLAADSARRAS